MYDSTPRTSIRSQIDNIQFLIYCVYTIYMVLMMSTDNINYIYKFTLIREEIAEA